MSLRLYIKPGPCIKKIVVSSFAFDELVQQADSSQPWIETTNYHPAITKELPEQINACVTKVTYRGKIGNGIHTRKCGQYGLRSATATIEWHHTGNNHYSDWLILEAATFADAKELYLRICAGTIMPTISFEEKQMAPVMRALDHLKAIWDIISMPTRNWCRQFKDKWVKRWNNA